METSFTWTVSWCFQKLLLFSHHFRHSSHLRRYLLPAISWQSYDLYSIISSNFLIKESFAASSSLSDISSLRSSWCFHKLLLFSHHFRHSSHFWVFFLIFYILTIFGDIFYINCFVMFSQASFIFASLQALFTFMEISFTSN